MNEHGLRLNVKEVLSFFDEKPKWSIKHATAIVGVMGEDLGVALLQHYLENSCGETCAVMNDQGGYPQTPTPGTSRGERLDRWLLATKPDGSRTIYQIEIKNWSAHAIGGKPLALDASLNVHKVYGRSVWQGQWNGEKNSFRTDNVSKVLNQMKIPTENGRVLIQPPIQKSEIEPLLCFWSAVHPEGNCHPLFRQSLGSEGRNGFTNVSVFSMSNYLRSLPEDEIVLPMPTASQRISALHRIFQLDCQSRT